MDGRDERRVIVEGLAASAVTLAEMGATEADARNKLLDWLMALRVTDPAAILYDAAVQIGASPQPLGEPADKFDRAQRIRDLLGLKSPAEQLGAMLKAREWVQRLADDLATRSGDSDDDENAP